MALRLRRGTDVERQTITPLSGELLYVTDTGLVYVGDGATQGGTVVGGTLELESSPTLSADLNLNGNNIIGNGNINIDGSITATGNITIGDGVEDNVIVGGTISSSLIPTTDTAFDLGSTAFRWQNGHFTGLFVDGELSVNNISLNNILTADSTVLYDALTQTFEGNFRGSLLAEDSSVAYESDTGIFQGEFQGFLLAENSAVIIDNDSRNANFNNAIMTSARITTLDSNIITIVDNNEDAVTLFANGLVVEEDTEFNIISNNFSVATRSDFARLEIKNEGTDRQPLKLTGAHNPGELASEIALFASRGTLDNPLALEDRDYIFYQNYYGWNGSTYNVTAQITGRVGGPVNNGIIPGRVDFTVADFTGALPRVFSILPDPAVAFLADIIIASEVTGFENYSNDQEGSQTFRAQRFRGSRQSRQAVQSNDTILKLEFEGFDGSSEIISSRIVPSIDGTVSTGVVPGKITFQTANSNGTLQDVLTIDSARSTNVLGDLNVNGVVEGNLIGSVFAQNSSLIIDASNSSLQVANVDIVGETGNTPADSGTVDSWLEVSVNGATKYIPLYS